MKKQFTAFAIIFALGIASQSAVAMAPGRIVPEYGKLSGLRHTTLQAISSACRAGYNALATPVHGIKAVSNALYLPVTVAQGLASHAKVTSLMTGFSLGAYMMYLIATCPKQGFTSHEHFAAIIQFIQNHWGKAAVGSLVVVINALLANMKNKFVAGPVILATIIGVICMWYTAPDGLMSHPFIQDIMNGSINFASDVAGQIALFLEHCPEYAVTLKQFMCDKFQTNCIPVVQQIILTPLEQAQQNLSCSDVSQLIDRLNCIDLMKPAADTSASAGYLSNLWPW